MDLQFLIEKSWAIQNMFCACPSLNVLAWVLSHLSVFGIDPGGYEMGSFQGSLDAF